MSEQTLARRDGVPDAPLHLEIPRDSPMRFVIKAEDNFLGAISEVGREVIQRPGQPVRWLLAHATTRRTIRLRLRAVPDRDDVPARSIPDVVRAVATGFEELERAASRPAYFNDNALEKVGQLAETARDLGSMRVVNGTVGTDLTRSTEEHVRSLLGTSYTAIGSVEGRLQRVNLHDRRTFFIYDTMTGKPIRCDFGDRIPLAQVAAVLGRGRRVIVYGAINYRSDDQIASVLAHELVEFPDEDAIPSPEEMRRLIN